jgi:hypothetical protein
MRDSEQFTWKRMHRRTFLTLMTGTAAVPLLRPRAAHAALASEASSQRGDSKVRAQQGALPVVGYIGSSSAEVNVKRVAAFRKGLADTGFVEGRNVAIE